MLLFRSTSSILKIVNKLPRNNKMLKFVTGLIAGTMLAASSLSSASAESQMLPFDCSANIYQISDGQFYSYDPIANKFTLMSSSTQIANLNAMGFNSADKYIYGLKDSTHLYKFYNDGSNDGGRTLISGAAEVVGGDFVAPNKMLTVGDEGAFTLLDVSTLTVSAFTSTPINSWKANDMAFAPGSNKIYGVDGHTLYIGTLNLSTSSVSVSTKTIQGLGADSGWWGAAYLDVSGNSYFYNNTSHNVFKISAAELANSSPTAVLATNSSGLAGGTNDGASCPLASSPFGPIVTTTDPTVITSSTATLHGTVSTGSISGSAVPVGDIKICYSTSNAIVDGLLEDRSHCFAATPSSLPISTPPTAVELPVTGLSLSTIYYYQTQATNTAGRIGFGQVVDFIIPAAVTFMPNGGSGQMSNQINTTPEALHSSTFTRSGYVFNGWNTNSDGSGSVYLDGQQYNFVRNMTMYAQWKPTFGATTQTLAYTGYKNWLVPVGFGFSVSGILFLLAAKCMPKRRRNY